MPLIRFSAFERAACRFKLVAVILLLSKIMPSYSRYVLKGLVYIIIIAPLGRQPSFCIKCIKLNIYLFCDIRSVFNIKCMFLICLYAL